MTIHLDNYVFDKWVEFVFDHPVSKPEWYFSDDWEWCGTPELILQNIIEMFKDPIFLINRYTPEQIEQGFWFLLGPEGKLANWLWDPNISWPLRRECIFAMTVVFEKLFMNAPLDEICFMWWDLLRNFEDNDDQRVNEAVFDALARILKLPSRTCQLSAFHGLGHLRHSKKEELIRDFLATHQNIDTKLKDYALAALEGNVL